ncbi:MAG: hypothetical protein WB792_13510 [Desulfobacterales bacterium]
MSLLSYGMPQVLQLAHAKISDSTIIAYIQNSGTVYNLDASQIVYLKQQGVSRRRDCCDDKPALTRVGSCNAKYGTADPRECRQ